MKRDILWVFLMVAPLATVSSAASFEATCSGTGCSGSYNGNTLTFSGPFPDGRAPDFPYNPFIEFSIGTNGGTFTSGGNTCDYGVILGGGNCDGEASFGAYLGPPDDTGLALGDVVSVKGTGTASGTFCWQAGCPASGGPPPLLFNLDVIATYQFTLTDPGTSSPFTWTGAQFTSVPEPATFLFATLGLAIVAARRRCRSRRSLNALTRQ